jgi:hypothetical protein
MPEPVELPELKLACHLGIPIPLLMILEVFGHPRGMLEVGLQPQVPENLR